MKGGTSFNFYRLCLEDLPSREEEELIFHLGGLMQLGNDIFDVWEDFGEGTQTMVTHSINIPELRETFKKDLDLTYKHAFRTPYPKKQILRFLKITTLAIARVFVCLDQFEALQRKSDYYFKIEDYRREQLICDMQKPANQLKAINYYLKNIPNFQL